MGRPVLAVAIGLAVIGAAACDDAGCGRGAAPPPTASVAPAAQAPSAPARLAAHVGIAPASVAWPALVASLGDVAKGWPRSFGAAVVGELGLPITVAELVSTDAPIAVALLAADDGRIDVAAALHLRAADRVVVLATAGEGARLRAAPEADGLVRLLPVRERDRLPAHLAILGNHLVAASSEAALRDAGRFVAQAAPPAVAEGVLARAELGPAASSIARALASRAGQLLEGLPGVAPRASPGDLAPLLDALAGGTAELRALSSLQGAEDGAFELTVTASPSLGSAAAALAVPHGPAAPWLALPREATLAVLVHASAVDRAAEATRASEALGDALGLVATRRARFGAALQDLARARSPSVAFALGATPEGPTAWFRAGLEDGDAAERALDELVSAAGKRSARATGTTLSGKATVVERVGDAVRLKVRTEADGGEAVAVDVLVRREGGVLLGAAGTDAAAALQLLRGASDEGAGLGARSVARRIAAAAPAHAALVLLDLAPVAPARPRVAGAALAASVSLQGTPRVTVVAEPHAVALLRAKLATSSP